MKKLNILLPICILNIISLCYLHNTSYFNKQCIFFSIGLLLLIICSKIKYKFIIKYHYLIYLITSFLLTLVLFIGKDINGSKAWIKIFNFSLQPSELAKISLIITLSYLTTKRKSLIYLIILTTIPTILTFLEPDTGAIIIYLIILLSTFFYQKTNKKIILTLLTFASLFISINIFIYFKNPNILIKIYGTNLFYRFDRLNSFKNLDNIQNTYSLTSIGANKWMYIPENHNDFIFASIISKYNIIITILIIICYIWILIYYILKIKKGRNINNIFNFIILNMLLFSIFYNIAMNLSLVPIIGIPIPFLSYGGSYIISTYILIGLSINSNKNKVHYYKDN